MVERLATHDPSEVGPFGLVARLGAGGMGQVFLGRDGSGALAAVKMLHLGLAGDAELLKRFRREVDVIAEVRTRYTASFLGADLTDRPPWLATEYVQGLTLAEVGDVAGMLPERMVRTLGIRLADGLQAIHGFDVVHRDLKPSNVIVVPDGVRIIDFGIALPGDTLSLTRSHYLHGTVGYMAPERFQGRSGTPASDVFALAAILVHASTSRLPFAATSMEHYLHALWHEQPRLTGVPLGMTRLLRECLTPQPEDRPSVRHVRAALARDHEPAPPGGWLPQVVLDAIAGRRADIAGLLRPGQRSVPPVPLRGRNRGVASVPRPDRARPGPPQRDGEQRDGEQHDGEQHDGEQHDGEQHDGEQHDGEPRGAESRDGAPRGAPRPATEPPAGWRPWKVTHAAMVRTATVVSGDAVIVSADDGLRVHETHDGSRRWERQVPTSSPYRPVVAGGVVVCDTGGRLDGVDLRTGRAVWSLAVSSRCEPLVAAGLVHVVGDGPHNLVAVDPATGTVRWRSTSSTVRPARSARGVVIAHGRTVQERDTGGERLWRYADLPAAPTGVAVSGDAVLVRAADRLTVLDAATGVARWSRAGLPPRTMPVVAAGLAVQPSTTELLALDLADGTVRWRRPSTGTGTLATGFGVVWLTSTAGLTAIDAATGRTGWTVEAASISGDVSVSDELVHLVATGLLRAHRRTDGVERWTADDLYAPRGPVVCDGVVYLENGYTLYAIAASTGDRRST